MRGRMTGWHFTDIDSWNCIQIQGMIPQYIKKEHIRRFSPNGVGCWVWTEKPTESFDILGMIMDRIQHKDSQHIVLLEVNYDASVSMKCLNEQNGDHLKLVHDGTIGERYYHKQKSFDIVVSMVAPCDLFLVKEWNFAKLMSL